MLRRLKRQRKDPQEAAPPSPSAAAETPASERTPSVSSATASPPVTPAAATAQNQSPLERRDSDEFFTSAIHELDGDDFLLSPQKVTVADINSVAEALPPSSSRQWTRSLHSAAGSNSPPAAQQLHHQRTRSGSSGGGGSVSRSLFTASEDDQSWLVAAPSGNGRGSAGDLMLEDSPPRRASGRGAAANAFSQSPSRIPSGPMQSPSASGSSGRSRIPKPTLEYASPVKAGGSGGAGGSRIPASPTPSGSSGTRIPRSTPPSPAHSEERPVQQYSAPQSRLPRGPTASSQEFQGPPAALEPLRHYQDDSNALQPAAQAMEPDAEPAPASPKADTSYSEPYLPQSMLQPQPQPQPPPLAQHVPPQRQAPTEQPEASIQGYAAADGGEGADVAGGDQRPTKADNLAAATDQKPQTQRKPQQQAAQKDKGCCGCCIM